MPKEKILALLKELPIAEERRQALIQKLEANSEPGIETEVLTEIEDVLEQEEIDILREDPGVRPELEAALTEAETEIKAAEEDFAKEMAEINQAADDLTNQTDEKLKGLRMDEIKQEAQQV